MYINTLKVIKMLLMIYKNIFLAYVPSGYLGCYVDKSERILSDRMPNSASNTGDECKQKCKAAGYRYAGTEVRFVLFYYILTDIIPGLLK